MSESFSPELLRAYYQTVFPAELMCRWLGYGTNSSANAQLRLLRRREFSFTTGDEIYIRYLSYDDAKAFRKDLTTKLPYKIDIGATYSAPPSEHKKFKVFQPVQRELIFDVDLTDYDFLQVDAGKIETCDACWPMMTVAVKVVDMVLRRDFGFEHLLWVYSGRRGIHCWVCDERARNLTNEGRSAVCDYLSLQLRDKRMVVHTPMHPTLAAAHREVLMPFFESSVLGAGGLGLFESEPGWSRVLAMLGDDELAQQMQSDFSRKADGLQRWELLKRALEKKKLSRVELELVFSLTYPRLDVHVSKGMNHLLKSPWCAHPKTGRVCVPFDPSDVDSFDPSQVPTLGQVMCDINEYDAQHSAEDTATGEAARTTDMLHKTRLKVPAEIFQKFVRGLEAAERNSATAAAKASLGAALDF